MMKALKQVSVGIYPCFYGHLSLLLCRLKHRKHYWVECGHSLPVGGINWGMKAYERGYLRARAEISADKDGNIFGQKRRYLPAKPHKGLTDKVHIVVIIPPTGTHIKC